MTPRELAHIKADAGWESLVNFEDFHLSRFNKGLNVNLLESGEAEVPERLWPDRYRNEDYARNHLYALTGPAGEYVCAFLVYYMGNGWVRPIAVKNYKAFRHAFAENIPYP